MLFYELVKLLAHVRHKMEFDNLSSDWPTASVNRGEMLKEDFLSLMTHKHDKRR